LFNPKIITLENARKLNPHTPVWVEWKMGKLAIQDSLTLQDECWCEMQCCRFRVWNKYPSESIRINTAWE
jgi:hypothetical protein